MEVRKVNVFFPIFIVGYIALSILAGSVMAVLVNMGIPMPDWIQYVISEGIILVIAIIYMVVNRDRKSTRLNSSHASKSRMPSSA